MEEKAEVVTETVAKEMAAEGVEGGGGGHGGKGGNGLGGGGGGAGGEEVTAGAGVEVEMVTKVKEAGETELKEVVGK